MDRARQVFVEKLSHLLAQSLRLAFQDWDEVCQWVELTLADGTTIKLEADQWDFLFRFTFPDGQVIKSNWYNYLDKVHV